MVSNRLLSHPLKSSLKLSLRLNVLRSNYCCFQRIVRVTKLSSLWYFVVLVFRSSSRTTFWLLSFTMKFSRFSKSVFHSFSPAGFYRRTFCILPLPSAFVNHFFNLFFGLCGFPSRRQLVYLTKSFHSCQYLFHIFFGYFSLKIAWVLKPLKTLVFKAHSCTAFYHRNEPHN